MLFCDYVACSSVSFSLGMVRAVIPQYRHARRSGRPTLTSQCARMHPTRGGAAGIRTPDLRRARAALSRLSYGPIDHTASPIRSPGSVGAPGLEPGTSALSGPRSDHLSYAPLPCASLHALSHTCPHVPKTKQMPVPRVLMFVALPSPGRHCQGLHCSRSVSPRGSVPRKSWPRHHQP